MAAFCNFSFSSRIICVDSAELETIRDLKTYIHNIQGLPQDAYHIVCNGSQVDDDAAVRENHTYHVCLRVLGGKGGFGSMLRAIGAQIEKTTNHEACRDLSGRRMRDINNEKDLKEWLSKQSEREKEREERRKERLARRRAMPNHKFSDPVYDKQRSLMAESQEEALVTGLQKTQSSSDAAGTKRKSEVPGTSGGGKKPCTEWLGVDMSDIDSDDSDDTTSTSDSHAGGSDQGLSNDSNPACSAEPRGEASDIVCGAAGSSAPEDMDVSEKTGTSGSVTSGNELNDKLCEENKQSTDVTTAEADSNTAEARPFCLEAVSAVEDVEALGLDRLKQELMDRGLKCGGTLQERAQRLFSVRGLTHDEIDPSLFAKAIKGKKVKNKK